MGCALTFAIGIGVGWIIFERPQWASDAFDWFKDKISSIGK